VSVGASHDGSLPSGLLRGWRGVARLQMATLEATPSKVGDLGFGDVRQLGWHMLKSGSCSDPAVPARVVAAGPRAIEVESGHEEQLNE
jgi:hypothetical protein